MNNFDTNLNKNSANFVPLSPLSFISRAKDIYPNYESLVYGNRSYTWLETYNRCTKFASALQKQGISKGDTVSIIAANTPEIFEAHYSIPMIGAVINTINTRLDAKTIAYILEHSDAKLLITDTQFSPTMKKALNLYGKEIPIIDIHDEQAIFKEGEGERIGKCGDSKKGEGKPKCLSKSRAASLRAKGGKAAIAAAVRKKRREDPNKNRKGKAKNVSNTTRKKKKK